MKGIAHFISGIAVATFFPDAVRQAADGSLVLALGGLFALLPDTLDFRFTRYLETYDEVIDPDPAHLQPEAVARRVAVAMRAAYEAGRPRTIVLYTLRVGPDVWRRYSLCFDPAAGEVVVRVGPIVSTSGAPLPGSAPVENAVGRASVGVPLLPTRDDEITIDAFSGPSLRFERHADGVHVTFLPWHRRWTHSLALAAALGLALGGLLSPTAGLVGGLAWATHVLQDQMGQMGANLLWPFTQRRSRGLGVMRSGDPLPNFLTVWLAAALILFNLDRFSGAPRLPAVPYLLAAVLLPTLLLGAHYRRSRRRDPSPSPAAQRQAELLAETEELEM